VDAEAAARSWIDAWTRAWRTLDADALEPVYAPDAVFRSHPFREPQNPIEYARWALSEEEGQPEVWMGAPIVSGDRAALEWWAAVIENGKAITLAGASMIRFGDDGRVVEQTDYWGQADGRTPPFEGWASSAP
jgi:ketosteroid isomerase-like protein